MQKLLISPTKLCSPLTQPGRVLESVSLSTEAMSQVQALPNLGLLSEGHPHPAWQRLDLGITLKRYFLAALSPGPGPDADATLIRTLLQALPAGPAQPQLGTAPAQCRTAVGRHGNVPQRQIQAKITK